MLSLYTVTCIGLCTEHPELIPSSIPHPFFLRNKQDTPDQDGTKKKRERSKMRSATLSKVYAKVGFDNQENVAIKIKKAY